MDLKSFQNDMWNVLRCIFSLFSWKTTREIVSRFIFSLFSWKTVRKIVSRFIFNLFYRKTTRKIVSRYIFNLFYRKTARKMISRYLWSRFSLWEGMRDGLALPLDSFSPPRGHVRSPCVTSWLIFSSKWAREKPFMYSCYLFCYM